MERPTKWEDYMHLAEFAYNNGQASVDVFVTSECIHLYIFYCISLYPEGDVCSSDQEIH